MPDTSYPLFCPVAMASELIGPRWTLLILCEMWSGSTRFSQIQRGVPGMSPGLLSKRLKEMEAKGLVSREGAGSGAAHSLYFTTPSADRLEPVVRQLGQWAHENIDREISLRSLDAQMLMWNIRRKINQFELPLRNCTIQFTLKDRLKPDAHYWLLIKSGMDPDLCRTNPGFDVDLFIVSELVGLTSAWMGHTSFDQEIETGRITIIGHSGMARSITRWMVRSCYASASADELAAIERANAA